MTSLLVIGLLTGVLIGLPILVLGAAIIKEIRKRKHCPSCGQNGLCCIRIVRPKNEIDYKSRLENTVSYYRCKLCGTNYKRHFPSKLLEKPSTEELANYYAGELR
jgi:hypothetical protein